jgi:signal transduction histidine kinase
VLQDHGHLGVVGMVERARTLGGRLEVASRPGGGTTVQALVPLR